MSPSGCGHLTVNRGLVKQLEQTLDLRQITRASGRVKSEGVIISSRHIGPVQRCSFLRFSPVSNTREYNLPRITTKHWPNQNPAEFIRPSIGEPAWLSRLGPRFQIGFRQSRLDSLSPRLPSGPPGAFLYVRFVPGAVVSTPYGPIAIVLVRGHA